VAIAPPRIAFRDRSPGEPTDDHVRPCGDGDPVTADQLLSPRDASRLTADQRWAWVGYLRARDALAEAAEWLDTIEQYSGPTVRAQEERAALLMAAGRNDEAVAILQRRAEERPSTTGWVKLAVALLGAGRTDEAARIATGLLDSDPDMRSVQNLALDIARATGDGETIASHAHEQIAVRPGDTTARLDLAQVALDAGNHDEAEQWFGEALDLRADGEGLTLQRASEIARALGRDRQADELAAEFETRSQQAKRQRDRTVVAPILERLGRPAPATILPPAASRLPADWPRAAARPAPDRPIDGPRSTTSRVAAEEPDLEVAPAEEPTDLHDRHPEVYDLLRRAFGYDDLRSGQAAVIANVLDGKDTIAIMPTGAGKSLTFQIPAMLLPGVTLVLSPLIALMKDQVESLPDEIRERTVLVNSTMTPAEQREAMDGIAAGRYKLVYVAPERLRQWTFLHAMRQAGTSLVVVDEAHCISMWGHDFRPDYLQIPQILPALNDPSVLAITATATRRMSAEIGQALGRELDLMTVNLFRPNLYFSAFECANREEKVRRALEVAQGEKGAGIIYVGSRADADQIANSLRQRGVAAAAYHAGLAPDERSRNQDAFMQGRVRVVAATVAFGMGVNKADVRFIVHLAPPRSLEAYAQESGRAGRDGEPARCVLLYSAYDSTNLTRQSRRDQITIPALRRVYLNLRAMAQGKWAILDPRDLLPAGSLDTDNNEIEDVDPRVALGILAQAGLVRRHPDAPMSFGLQPHDGFSAEETPDGQLPWREHVRWSWDGSRVAGGQLDTITACNALGVTPTILTELLDNESELGVREGNRQVCLELLPADATVKNRMMDVLDRSQAEAVRRVAQVMEYASGQRCRHQAIAAHLGQRLPACGTACDVCSGTVARGKSGGKGGKRVWTTANDAMEVLEAVRTLPFQMGKTGLTRLLSGSVESSVRDDRSAQYGALDDVSPTKIGNLLDQLIDDGFLDRDMSHDYKLISLTRKGDNADRATLIGAGYPEDDNSNRRGGRRR
jgi:ATP-dependent DNA helicase RecQ